MATTQPASRSFRIAAAALAAAPVGFAAGALFAGRPLANPRLVDGITVLSYGLVGAIGVALLLALVALTLPPKPVRIVTLVFAGASFAILVYMVQDYVRERFARAAATDATFADMPHFALTLWAKDPQRKAFSRLEFSSETREYTAVRPGGWRCEGRGNPAQAVAVFQAMQTVTFEAHPSCDLRASWRNIGAEAGTGSQGCVGFGNSLFAAVDEMIEATERKASCRRADAPTPSPSQGVTE